MISFIYNSINEINTKTFSIYPNPSDGDFNIDLNASSNVKSTIEIYDVLGTLLFNEHFKGRSIKVNSENYKSGMYFIKVSGEMNSQVQKIIVKKK